MDDFCSQLNVLGMEMASSKVDDNPGERYNRSLSQIRVLPQADIAELVLAWLTFSKTSMDTDELAEALAIVPGEYSINPKAKFHSDNLEEICCGLVVLDKSSNYQRLRLAHKTVQEHIFKSPDFSRFKQHICCSLFTYLTYVSRPLGRPSARTATSSEDSDDSDSEVYGEEESPVGHNLQDAGNIVASLREDAALNISPDADFEAEACTASSPYPQNYTDEGDELVEPEENDNDSFSDGQLSEKESSKISSQQEDRDLSDTLSEGSISDLNSIRGLQRGFFTDRDYQEDDAADTDSPDSIHDHWYEREQPNSLDPYPSNLALWVQQQEKLSDYAGSFALAHLDETTTNSEIENSVYRFVLDVFTSRRRTTLGLEDALVSEPVFGMRLSHLAVYIGLTNVMESILGHPDFEIDAADNYGRTALAWSLKLNKPEIAQLLLDAGADPNAKDCDGDSTICYVSGTLGKPLLDELVGKTSPENLTSKALQLAILENNDTMLALLLRNGVSFDYGENGKSNSALHDAVEWRREAMVTRLLRAGVDSSRQNAVGRTALALCCKMSLFDYADRLLRHRADPTIVDDDLMTPLHFAAAGCKGNENSVALVKGLIHAKADPAAVDRHGQTPLMYFLDKNREASKDLAREMVTHLCPSASIALHQSKDGRTAMHLAAQWHKPAIIRFLAKLTNGLGMDVVDAQGRSPLLLVFQREDESNIKRLLKFELGNALDLVYQGRTILDEAIAIGDTALVQKLLKLRPTLLGQATEPNRTALFTAAKYNRLEIFELLLKKGLDPLLQRSNGDVVLHEICRLGRLEMAHIVIGKKAWLLSSPTTPVEPVRNLLGDTMLHSAAESTSVQVLELVLKECGLNVNERNLAGDGPLQVCSRQGSPEMVRMLLEAKAEVNVMNNAGKTALDFALEREDSKIVGDLLRYHALPGLLWTVESIGTKWAKEKWIFDLEQVISHASGSFRNRFACDSRWAVQCFRRKKSAHISERSKDVPYLEVPIPGSAAAQIRRITFRSVSHDQGMTATMITRLNYFANNKLGWSDVSGVCGHTYQHTWTWFEAAAYRQERNGDAKSVIGPRRTFQRNVHASDTWRAHTNIWDYRDTQPGLRTWLGSLRPGDTLAVYPKALFAGWENNVKNLEITIHFEDSLSFSSIPQSIDQHPLPCEPFSPRVIVYFQTHHQEGGEPVSLRPLVDKNTGVTHVIVAAFHLNEKPGDITLNDDRPDDPKNETLWTDVSYVQKAGVKVMAMLGGASKGTYKRLDVGDDDFIAYYKPLRRWLRKYRFDGIDLDVEEPMSISGMKQLIDQLRLDFGKHFLISLAPVATAMMDSSNISGFDYELLELRAGHLIDWYNVQLYCGWSEPGDQMAAIRAIMHRGWPSHKIVLGQSTNPSTDGFVDCNALDNTLAQLRSEMVGHAAFGGVMGWEYFDSLPGGTKAPWLWAQEVSQSISRHWPSIPSIPTSGGDSTSEQTVNVELTSTEITKTANTAVDRVVTVEMKATGSATVAEIAQTEETDGVVPV